MERTGMGKLVMQMAVTIALLGGICAWNLHRADERVAAMLEQGGVQLPVIMYHSILKDEACGSVCTQSGGTRGRSGLLAAQWV